MAARTFVPVLIKLGHHFCNYIAKHHPVIVAAFGGPTDPRSIAMDAAAAACTAFTALVVIPPEQP